MQQMEHKRGSAQKILRQVHEETSQDREQKPNIKPDVTAQTAKADD
jgi:hypothetical protein